jgi:hypothetical protein
VKAGISALVERTDQVTKTQEATQPTFEQMKAFLAPRYKHDRLYGVAPWPGCGNYGDRVVQATLDELLKHGACCAASQYESITGRAIWCQAVAGEIREVDSKTALGVSHARALAEDTFGRIERSNEAQGAFNRRQDLQGQIT